MDDRLHIKDCIFASHVKFNRSNNLAIISSRGETHRSLDHANLCGPEDDDLDNVPYARVLFKSRRPDLLSLPQSDNSSLSQQLSN